MKRRQGTNSPPLCLASALEDYPGGLPLDHPSVTVVVALYNEVSHLPDLIRDILAQDYPQLMEICFADGGSDDGTREILRQVAKKDGRVRLIDNPGRIASTGLNLALGLAKGAVIVRMDGHTSYAADYVRCCLESQKQTNADNVGGPARTTASGYLQKAIAAAYHSVFSVGGAKFHNPNYEGPVDTVPYGCWCRGVFDRFGTFDEEIGCNEDDEHNLRIIRRGGRIWQSPRIKSWYHPRRSLSELFWQYMRYGYWKVPVIQKHRLPASPRHLAPAGFLATLLLTGVLAIWTPLAATLCLALSGLYISANLAASLSTALRRGPSLFPVLPIVFCCYHLAYGLGFVVGLIHSVLMRSKPRAR